MNDITLNYNFTKKLYTHLGAINFITLFSTIYGISFFSMSTDWTQNNKYILKFKGDTGDLIINWQ